jgi:peptidoglycan/LPS O-acetylase OafA/YrhL
MSRIRKFFHLEISKNRIFGLDLLRFIAIFMVLLGHSLILAPANIKPYVYPFIFDGVAIFFVLSGFLIGGILIKILIKEKPSYPVLLDFWKRRWMRTLPAYFLVLIFLLIYTFIFLPKNFPEGWYRFFFFTQNFLGHYRPGFFAEAWSLSIEEWFYLLVPLILFSFLIIFKTSTKYTILIVSLLIIALVTFYRYHLYYSFGIPINPNEQQIKLFKKFLSLGIDYQVIPRLDSIMYGVVGAFFAHYTPKIWNNKLNFLLIFICLYILYLTKFQMGKSYGPFAIIWSPSLISLAIFFMLPFLSNLRKGLGKWTSWITYFSLISYSMYLVNLNIVTIAIIKHTIHGDYSMDKFIPGDYWVLDYILFWILTIFISFILYKFIEVPFMKMRDKKKIAQDNV